MHRSSHLPLAVSLCAHTGPWEASTWAWGIVQACLWLALINFPLSLAQGLPALSHLEPGALWGRRWEPHGHRLVRLHPGGPHAAVPQDSSLVTTSCCCRCLSHLPGTMVPAPSVGGRRSPDFSLSLLERALVSRLLVGIRLQAPLTWLPPPPSAILCPHLGSQGLRKQPESCWAVCTVGQRSCLRVTQVTHLSLSVARGHRPGRL